MKKPKYKNEITKEVKEYAKEIGLCDEELFLQSYNDKLLANRMENYKYDKEFIHAVIDSNNWSSVGGMCEVNSYMGRYWDYFFCEEATAFFKRYGWKGDFPTGELKKRRISKKTKDFG